MQSSLDKLFLKTISFLEKQKIPYLIIGGLAVGVLGEPRMTQDIDLIIFILKDFVSKLLDKVKNEGYSVNKKLALKEAYQKGTFRIEYKRLWVDMIISSTEFENSALKRKKQITLFGKKVNFPSPEDLILLKIIPGREKDILDAKTVIERHGNKLDKKYLELWAQKLSDEAEDMRIWNTLKKIL